MELNELAEHLYQEVIARTEGDGSLEGPDDAFTEIMVEYLTEANEADGAELSYSKRPGRRNAPAYKINAWHLYGEGGACLDLFVTLYKPSPKTQAIAKAEVSEHFTLARSFLQQALHAFGGRLDQLEESAPPFEAAQAIHGSREGLDTVRIFLLSNAVAKASKEPDLEIEGITVRHFLWDLEKLLRIRNSGRDRAVVELDLVGDYGGAIPCLAHEDGTNEYTSYLAYLPAPVLAEIYGDHGPRLLEKNVRSYLQARGKVNRGIQQTLKESPHRFLAYNNGISATAEHVELTKAKDGTTRLERIRDFQIVNGGQTTASIYHALKREKTDIGNVTVQVKLTVVKDAAKTAEFVPLISLYANSQNKINTADFSANDVFHQKLEALSRTIWAPAIDGMSRPTHWYYERARGSYLDDRARAGTPAKQKAWEVENPLKQKFTKTDIAKYEHTWDQRPDLVSRGAEKNFIEWTINRQKMGETEPNQTQFQNLIAKAILFRRTEKLVSTLDLGGYRANVVTYSLARLSRETSHRLDLNLVWKEQRIREPLERIIETIARAAHSYLVNGAIGKNVTEWAKKEDCWEGFRELEIALPGLSSVLAEADDVLQPQSPEDLGHKTAAESGGDVTAQIQRIKPALWVGLSSWGRESGLLQAWQITLCQNFSRKLERGKKPSIAESEAILDMLTMARSKGFEG